MFFERFLCPDCNNHNNSICFLMMLMLLGVHAPAHKCRHHSNYRSKLASWNSHCYPGYLPETVGNLQFEPTLPHSPGFRITVVLTNSVKLQTNRLKLRLGPKQILTNNYCKNTSGSDAHTQLTKNSKQWRARNRNND